MKRLGLRLARSDFSINVSYYSEEHDESRNKDRERAGHGVEKTGGDAREAGEPSQAHLVLCHARLQFLDLGVRCLSPRAVPILLLPPALPLQLLELQVLVGTLGHIQLFLHLWADVQKGWRPEALGLRGVRGWGPGLLPINGGGGAKDLHWSPRG